MTDVDLRNMEAVMSVVEMADGAPEGCEHVGERRSRCEEGLEKTEESSKQRNQDCVRTLPCLQVDALTPLCSVMGATGSGKSTVRTVFLA